MRERANRAEYDEEQYHVGELLQSSKSKRRLDLNDLLKRAKEQKESDNKLNLLIYIGALSAVVVFGLIAGAGIKLIAKSEMSQRNILILALSRSFGIGLYAFPEFVAHIPDFGIKLKLLLTTGLIPAGLLAFTLNATLPKK